MLFMNDREGKTYRHRMSQGIVLVVRSKRMSHSTTRHVVIVLDSGMSHQKAGAQSDVDETPANVWSRSWEELS